MREEIKLLTKKTKHGSHHETKLFIDWTDVTQEELMILARRALVYGFQLGVTRDVIPGVPETYSLVAKEEAADKTPTMTIVFAPHIPKPGTAKIGTPSLEDLLAELSPDEIRKLLEEPA